MKRYRKLAVLALVVGLVGAMLATAGAASGSVSGAKLDLVLNDAGGDSFQLIPAGGSTTHTQTLTTQACRVNSSGDPLVALSASANASNPAPGLKDHIMGVKAQGEGNGTPCARIDGNAAGRGEQLTINFTGDTIGNWYADYAQFGIKLKFGATGRIQALLDGVPVVGLFTTESCTGSDCGPDSGEDRVLFTLTAGEGQLFNGVRISVDSPSDGSISLLDDPAANLDSYFTLASDTEAPTIVLNGDNPLVLYVGDEFVDPGALVTDNFDPDTTVDGDSTVPVDEDGIITAAGLFTITYNAEDSAGNQTEPPVVRDVIVYDGILDCGDETELVGGTAAMEGIFKRLSNIEGICSPKPYTLNETVDEEFGSTVLFDPVGEQSAAYSGIVSGREKAGNNPTFSTLSYDPEGGFAFVDMEWCFDATIDSETGYVTTAELPEGETWCIAAESTVTVGDGDIRTTWTVYGHDDPRMSGG
jgi:hypothetical protein